MAIKQTAHIIRGLRRDFSDSKQPKEYAIDAKNIRITNREDSSLLSITNEKGTKEIPLGGGFNLRSILGYSVLNNYIILFVKIFRRSLLDAIITYDVENSSCNILYSGNLGFKVGNPIEALSVYENKDIQKVYWVDGVNQPRVINIAAKQEEIDSWTDKSFDFIQELQLNETIRVEKSYSSGSFNSGVIQYAFNYYNRNGQESNIVEVTPINYISYEDRGAAPNDYVSNSFKITINNVDTNFDYLRLYSIHRTALDAIPSVKLVTDLKADKNIIEYIDTGTIGETIDPAELLYKGGEYIIPKTLTQKDGTLFFGNIKLNNNVVDIELSSDTIEEKNVARENAVRLSGDFYPYEISLDSNKITTFKGKETYRLGLQFQDKYGKWSDPIFIKDHKVDSYPFTTIGKATSGNYTSNYWSTKLKYTLSSQDISKLNSKFLKVRPVIVYPSDSDREVIAQGILCPTVFNYKDRKEGIRDVQSSWFFRPTTTDMDIIGEDWAANNYFEILTKKGSLTEFRHNYSLPANWSRDCEIQSNRMRYSSIVALTAWEKESNAGSDTFFIDKSIVTFHSPEIEFEKVTNINNLKLRVVGAVSITSRANDIDISLRNAAIDSSSENIYNGIEDYIDFGDVKAQNHMYSPRTLGSGLFYFDKISEYKSNINVKYDYSAILNNNPVKNTVREPLENLTSPKIPFVVYPWHRSGSLNNDTENKTGVLRSKKISNLKFSAITQYFNSLELELADLQIFRDTDLYLNTPKNINKISTVSPKLLYRYSGNIDKIITPYLGEEFYFYPDGTASTYSREYHFKDGYPISVGYAEKYTTPSEDFVLPIYPLESVPIIDSDIIKDKYEERGYSNVEISNIGTDAPVSTQVFSKDNILMKYKSSPHGVFVLEYDNGSQVIIPKINTINTNNNEFKQLNEAIYNDIDNFKVTNIKQEELKWNLNYDTKYTPKNYLLLAELYREEVPNKFGGDDYKNNIWYPAGDSVRLGSEDVIIEFTQGDTFFARFDSLKTYSDDLDAVNSVTEIGSFMVETRINLDARYDRNRGKQSNLVMNPNNFNLFNDVYNQKNNFFNYRIIDKDIADNTEFPNTIVWSKQKFAGADIDAWTNINMASSLDLDGTKGELTKLVSFKNEIFSFQPEAINHILFNSRVQIPTSDGVPIELTNAYKVDGARQLSSIGSSNPLAITSTDRGIYYMDNITKGIYVFNGQVSDPLSDKLGMSSWVKKKDINSYRVDYDKINQDVYFNGDECLCYSEKLGEFESFFDYNNSEIFNVKDGTYAIKSNKLYKLFEGDYNNFFDNESKPFWVTFTHNENPFNDKIYNTLEFRADTYDYITKDENNQAVTPYWKLSNNSSLNTIKVDNEYQDTKEVSLEFNRFTPSNLKRKFRIWRANIPRDSVNKRDRIRNTWANITLKASNPSNTKTELHDLVVSYFM